MMKKMLSCLMFSQMFVWAAMITMLSMTVVAAEEGVLSITNLKDVPNASEYVLVQGVDIAAQMYANFNLNGAQYDLADNVASLQKQGVVFDRVAYLMEYAPTAEAPTEYVFVSFDSGNMTLDVSRIGVPDFPSGIFYQQTVKNLEVASNVKGVQTGNVKHGYLEFWPCNYGHKAQGAIAQGSNALYDFNDSPGWEATSGYGSMQVHNLDALQTVFALNSFQPIGEHKCKAYGIGNGTKEHLDYTFDYGKEKYAKARLYMFVRPCKAVLTTNEKASGIEFYQRDKDGTALVPLSGTFKTADGATVQTIEATAENGTKAALTVYPNGTYAGAMSLPGGWHAVTIEARDAAGNVIATASYDKIGVGEIFITCGQSNSANHGDVEKGVHKISQTGNAVMYDLKLDSWVLSCDPQRGATGDNGSTWVPFGDALSAQLGVPVATVATGFGGSSVEQWQSGTDFLENRLLPAIRAMNGDFAGILWHQGEADFYKHTKKDDYYNKLRTVIYLSRKEAGWNVPWGVALVSYARVNGVWTTGGEALEAQKQVIADDERVLEGPNTDALDLSLRGKNGNQIHFGVDGLDVVGQQWAQTAKKIIELNKK